MSSGISDLLAESTAHCVPVEPETQSLVPSLTYSEPSSDDNDDDYDQDGPPRQPEPAVTRRRRASTRLISCSPADVQRITGQSSTELIGRCCGGGCCLGPPRNADDKEGVCYERVTPPDNDAFRSLRLEIGEIPTVLSAVADLPEQTAFLEPLGPDDLTLGGLDTSVQPPSFVQPHPPYHVFPARIHSARELTRPGAEKRTYHLDLDVTDYPGETGVDFKVGGAIGVAAPNPPALVDELLDLLGAPRRLRDRPVRLRTTRGRWPTVWGDDEPRVLTTTRRDLLTWCSDVQSYPPTKPLLRLLAEHCADRGERRLLLYLCSAEGQGAFCDLRTGPHVSLAQLLRAFPSARPPLDALLSTLQPLMPRFYSLSNDPHDDFKDDGQDENQEEDQEEEEEAQTGEGGYGDGAAGESPSFPPRPHHRRRRRHRIIEIAVTVHETADWRDGKRTGVGSGFLERQALAFAEAQGRGEREPRLYVPMFKGLMANPLARQFVSDGPMLLVGAGVGIAPFRGFVQRRLRTANCANKVWVLQGVRDSLLDELYSGEWGVHEDEVKRVVQSRRGEGRYVQEEVRAQADLVWYIANAVDGRVFVCGSSKGMGEGVEEALVDVAMAKGNLQRDEARRFWELKKEGGQYIAETW